MFDKDKLAQNIQELVLEQVMSSGIFESSEQPIGHYKGHAIVVKVTKGRRDVNDALETLDEHPNLDCIARGGEKS